MYRIAYIISIILISLLIAVTQPKMHKQAIITDSEYEFVEMNTDNSNIRTTNQNIAVSPVQNTTVPMDIQTSTQPNRPVNINQKQISSNSQKPVKQVSPPVKKSVNNPVTQTVKPAKQTKHTTTVSQPTNNTPQNQTAKPVQTQQVKTIEQKPIKPTLTEQEEIIAWNRWRSRLQNQVMMDSKIYAPIGTVFKFSFTVDKYGNMSNVKVWSTNPSYSNYAVRAIKPVLMSYRNQPILNFPDGTKRIIVNVDGGFTISTASRYSTPSDYHDYEKVKH